MEAIRLHRVVEKDGEIYIKDLPFKKGQQVEMILFVEPSSAMPNGTHSTARQLLNSRLVGLWKDRKDVTDSADYARQLREKAQRRQR